MRFVACVGPLDSLLRSLRSCLDRFPDKRRGINTTYPMGDIGMAAFSVFFMQQGTRFTPVNAMAGAISPLNPWQSLSVGRDILCRTPHRTRHPDQLE